MVPPTAKTVLPVPAKLGCQPTLLCPSPTNLYHSGNTAGPVPTKFLGGRNWFFGGSLVVSPLGSRPVGVGKNLFPFATFPFPSSKRGFPFATRGFPQGKRVCRWSKRGFRLTERGFRFGKRGFPVSKRVSPLGKKGFPFTRKFFPQAKRGFRGATFVH